MNKLTLRGLFCFLTMMILVVPMFSGCSKEFTLELNPSNGYANADNLDIEIQDYYFASVVTPTKSGIVRIQDFGDYEFYPPSYGSVVFAGNIQQFKLWELETKHERETIDNRPPSFATWDCYVLVIYLFDQHFNINGWVVTGHLHPVDFESFDPEDFSIESIGRLSEIN